MRTKRLILKENKQTVESQLKEAANIIKNGGLVAFPTETVYGLGANALNEVAAKKIYEAKGRPSDNPLIAHIADQKDLAPLVSYVSEDGKKLMEAFWPGPLTLIFAKSSEVPGQTTGGLDTVAIRMPKHPVARELIRLSKVPIAAPSANTSGRPSPTTADHVWQDLEGKIEMILDGGAVGIGVESTIIDVSTNEPMILRPGAVTQEMASLVLGRVIKLDPAITEGPLLGNAKPKAPGMKYKHYAPKADLTLVEGEPKAVVLQINKLVKEKLDSGLRVGVICTGETMDSYSYGIVRSLGFRAKEETIAHNLYGVLREFDDLGVDVIFSESFSKDHLGQAIMNRLMKAAGYQMIHTVEGGLMQ
ncbi:L-threonylcarbamoyladenylate synthase [Clostridium sp. E02]|uniref:L-threonylcarbamoyladenylate synthase n=1 Tax=Clostridium sp. E02 TaxID=2487134 RepID=UPI000F520AE4|nr:L-threonylcarbamoyladenylate synthase [Clostridium sp. E02]